MTHDQLGILMRLLLMVNVEKEVHLKTHESRFNRNIRVEEEYPYSRRNNFHMRLS